MPVVKLTLSEENYERLKNNAEEKKKTLQEYIRDVLFNENTIFTPEEAVKRAHKLFSDGREFELPDVYGDEWTIKRGPAGVFGKRFFNYITDNPDEGIHFINMGKYGRRATYKIIGGEKNESDHSK